MVAKEEILGNIAEEYLSTMRNGGDASCIQHYVDRYPEWQDEIRGLLKSLQQVEHFGIQETHKKRRQFHSTIAIRDLPDSNGCRAKRHRFTRF